MTSTPKRVASGERLSPHQGAAGANGTNGTNGNNGAPGSVWYEGAGAPGVGTGVNGDYYLNTTNGDVYTKAGGVWGAPVTNIKGAAGANGTNGTNGTNGANGAPGSVWYEGAGALAWARE